MAKRKETEKQRESRKAAARQVVCSAKQRRATRLYAEESQWKNTAKRRDRTTQTASLKRARRVESLRLRAEGR